MPVISLHFARAKKRNAKYNAEYNLQMLSVLYSFFLDANFCTIKCTNAEFLVQVFEEKEVLLVLVTWYNSFYFNLEK